MPGILELNFDLADVSNDKSVSSKNVQRPMTVRLVRSTSMHAMQLGSSTHGRGPKTRARWVFGTLSHDR